MVGGARAVESMSRNRSKAAREYKRKMGVSGRKLKIDVFGMTRVCGKV